MQMQENPPFPQPARCRGTGVKHSAGHPLPCGILGCGVVLPEQMDQADVGMGGRVT